MQLILAHWLDQAELSHPAQTSECQINKYQQLLQRLRMSVFFFFFFIFLYIVWSVKFILMKVLEIYIIEGYQKDRYFF